MTNKPTTTEDFVRSTLTSKKKAFTVSAGQHYSSIVHQHLRPLFRSISRLESTFYEDELDKLPIKRPVYISGLARAGSTILLELLNETKAFGSHLYRDYPYVDIPIIWNKWQDLSDRGPEQKQERAHMDRIEITPHSPEAFEEMIWMDHFTNAHNPNVSHTLTTDLRDEQFEKRYQRHIQKILFTRKKDRYLAKNNYNISRLEYIHGLFPDAIFIIPIREPISHLGSLVKQHLLFSKLEQTNPRALQYMNCAGHFEFGLGRTATNTGDCALTKTIETYWTEGKEVLGWATYWNMLHTYILNTLQQNTTLAKKVVLVDFDTFCTEPKQQLANLFTHCELAVDESTHESLARRIHKPTYYRTQFTPGEEQTIRNICDSTYRQLKDLQTL